MIFISHRRNTIDELKRTSEKYGVEIDLRSSDNSIIVHHDPMAKGEKFSTWLDHYNHKFLILNVKEEGLEKQIIDFLQKYKIDDYFFLDQSIPFLLKFSNFCNKKSAARVSEFESIETALKLKKYADWVWLDQFNSFPITPDEFETLKSYKYKICLVSPELQGRFDDYEIMEMSKFLKKNNLKLDAICSKKCEFWESLLNE